MIEMTLAPLLMVSATGLLILGLGNRMGRVIDRLREFSKEVRSGINEERRKIIMAQKNVLTIRAKLCRDAMVQFHLTILFSSLTSLFIFSSTIWSITIYLGILFFILSIISLIIGSVIAVYEISLSYSAILRESEYYLK